MATEKVIIHTKESSSGKTGKKVLYRSQLNSSISEDKEELFVIIEGDDELSVPKEVWELWTSMNNLSSNAQLDNHLRLYCESSIEFCEKLMKTYDKIAQDVEMNGAKNSYDLESTFTKVADIVKLTDNKSKIVYALREIITSKATSSNTPLRFTADLLFAAYLYMTASMNCFSAYGIQIDALISQKSDNKKPGFFEYRKIIKMKKMAERRVHSAGVELNSAIKIFRSI